MCDDEYDPDNDWDYLDDWEDVECDDYNYGTDDIDDWEDVDDDVDSW